MSKENVSIVVVGCGIAGFSCATKLIEMGFKDIKILEAEDRIGGRIFTTDFSGGLIDLGAQWCHGIDGNVVYKLAGETSFAETKMDFTNMTFSRSDGCEADMESCKALMELCDNILSRIEGGSVETIDRILTEKFNEALEQNEHKRLDSFLANEMLDNFKKRESSYCGCENLTEIQADGFKKFKDCEGPTWLNWKGKGYKSIFEFVLKNSNVLRSNIDEKVLKSKEVTHIEWNQNSKSHVRCSDGSIYLADHVIVTVSLGVLKKNHQNIFSPELPVLKKSAIEKISFGTVGKIFLEFEDNFWQKNWAGFSLLWSEEDLRDIRGTKNAWFSNIYCFYTVDFLPNVLLGRLAGDKIAEMEKLSDEEVIESCEWIFDKFLPNLNRGKIVNVKTSKWKSSQNFCGTYSYQTTDDDSTKQLATPLQDDSGKLKVLFAGEATHDYYFSTVHGAIESGYREAERLEKIYSNC